MPRPRMGRPGLMRTKGRTAVIAGTATAVSGSMRNRSAKTQEADTAQQQAMVDQAANQAAAQVQEQQAATSPVASSEDRMARIRELGQMKSEGLLNDDEFAAEKAKILAD
jgi:hypothetical protein